MQNAATATPDLFQTLTQRRPLPPLHPKKVWRDDLQPTIAALNAPSLVKGVLHLLNDDLEAAHEEAQKNKGPDASYLHALVHRRQGDFSNSRYWLRSVREHRAWHVMRATEPDWDPRKFLAWCESCAEGCPNKSCDKLEALQLREMIALLESLG
jgi:hypothetical protein